MPLNIKKCLIISFTRRPDRTFQFFAYTMNNIPLARVNQIRDLGIIFDSKLSFCNHVNSIVSKASRALGFICRSLRNFTNIHTHKLLYYTYVRSSLEYGSVVWNPYYDSHTNTIESIQRKFTRILCYKFNIPRGTYETRLTALMMISLRNRRLYFDELFLYKIITERVSVNLPNQFNFHVPFRITRYTPTFYLPSVATNVEFYSIILRLKRQHNESFSNIDLICNSISRTKRLIIDSMPPEIWPKYN